MDAKKPVTDWRNRLMSAVLSSSRAGGEKIRISLVVWHVYPTLLWQITWKFHNYQWCWEIMIWDAVISWASKCPDQLHASQCYWHPAAQNLGMFHYKRWCSYFLLIVQNSKLMLPIWYFLPDWYLHRTRRSSEMTLDFEIIFQIFVDKAVLELP